MTKAITEVAQFNSEKTWTCQVHSSDSIDVSYAWNGTEQQTVMLHSQSNGQSASIVLSAQQARELAIHLAELTNTYMNAERE